MRCADWLNPFGRDGMAENFKRMQVPAPHSRVIRVFGELAVLTNFMCGDGSEAFARLSDKTKEELRALFGVLHTDLRRDVCP